MQTSLPQKLSVLHSYFTVSTIGTGFLYTTSIGFCNLFTSLFCTGLQYCREAAGPQVQVTGPSPVPTTSIPPSVPIDPHRLCCCPQKSLLLISNFQVPNVVLVAVISLVQWDLWAVSSHLCLRTLLGTAECCTPGTDTGKGDSWAQSVMSQDSPVLWSPPVLPSLCPSMSHQPPLQLHGSILR